MTAQAYQTTFNQLAQQGVRHRGGSGESENGHERYAALGHKGTGADRAARHGVNSAVSQAAFNQLTQQGFRPRVVSGSSVNGQDLYAALWDKGNGPAWAARHGLTSTAYQATFNQMTQQGFRPVCVSGYELAGKDHYAAIWEKS